MEALNSIIWILLACIWILAAVKLLKLAFKHANNLFMKILTKVH